MTVGPTSPATSPFQGFGVGNERQNRPSAVIERQEEAEPFRRDDEETRPAAVETQPTKASSKQRAEGTGRGAKVDFSV